MPPKKATAKAKAKAKGTAKAKAANPKRVKPAKNLPTPETDDEGEEEESEGEHDNDEDVSEPAAPEESDPIVFPDGQQLTKREGSRASTKNTTEKYSSSYTCIDKVPDHHFRDWLDAALAEVHNCEIGQAHTHF